MSDRENKSKPKPVEAKPAGTVAGVRQVDKNLQQNLNTKRIKK